jgi:hypothetical protein
LRLASAGPGAKLDLVSSTELVPVPKELRIERRFVNVARSTAWTWLPVALLAPLAFVVEAVPAAIGILLVAGLTLREFRRARADVLPHLERADAGAIDEAIDEIASMARRENNWLRKSFLLGLLANLELRAGNRDTALALGRESLRHPPRQRPVLQRSLQGGLAMILALDDQMDEALATLPDEPVPDLVTDLARMVVWARNGEWTRVAGYKYQRLPEMTGLRHNNRVMALLRAAALEYSGGGVLQMQRALDDARPRIPEEYDYLSSDWPELAAFIQAHPELHKARSLLLRP